MTWKKRTETTPEASERVRRMHQFPFRHRKATHALTKPVDKHPSHHVFTTLRASSHGPKPTDLLKLPANVDVLTKSPNRLSAADGLLEKQKL